ncbi:response regulator [bacterium]|nr:response regulator [bacterium]
MKRILVVDSDEQVASILSIKLKQAGFEAATAGNSADALRIIPEFRPDIIVSEMILPKMSGIDFMKRVKMNPETMRIPFVFLSSSRDVENKILALDMGAAAVLAKPLFINDLLENLKGILGEYELKNSSAPEENTPEGDISDISVLNILSILLENNSSGEVEFSASSDKHGVIFCDCGNVVRAETNDGNNKDGMEELYKILSWSDGTFSVNYGDIDTERNIFIPQKKIIEKSVEWFREYSTIIRSLPPVDTMLFLDFANFVENLNKLPDDIDPVIKNIGGSGTKISDIIDSCGGDRLRTAAYLKQLFELSVISAENVNSFYKAESPQWLVSCGKSAEVEENLPEEKTEIVENTEKPEEPGESGPVAAPVEESAGEPKKSAWDELAEQSSRRGKSGKIALFVLLLAIAAAIIIFIYYRGLI